MVKTYEGETSLPIEDFEVRCGSWTSLSGVVRRSGLRAGEPLEPFLEGQKLALLGVHRRALR